MGFFSKIMGDGGGSRSASGLAAMHPSIQGFYSNLADTMLYDYMPHMYVKDTAEKQARIDRFTPMGETADETRAFDMMRKGFAPTEESMRSDVGMFMNPFDDFVINDINRQAAGDYSIMKQYGNETGQMGSNRNMLAASDVEQNRLNNIGMFRQNQYNMAVDNVLNRVIPTRMQDASNLAAIGAFQRDLDMKRKLAPLTGLGMMAGIMGSSGLPNSAESTSKGPTKGLLEMASNAAAGYFTGGM